METRRWINHSLPQTLSVAVILLYLNAVFGLLGATVLGPLALVISGGQVAAGYGIANERRWGYQLGVGMALLPFALRFLVGGLNGVLATNVISLIFDIALVALLLHEQSREHQRIWFS